MGAPVVAHGDAAPVFETTEGVLNAVALPIERLVVRYRDLAASGGRDAGLDAALKEIDAEAGAVVATVAKQFARLRQGRQESRSTLVVVGLACGQEQPDQPALSVADGMKLRVQPAARASDTTRSIPFLARLAAVRCALRWVLSIISRSGTPACATSALKMRSNTPSRLQRTKRL